MLRRFLYGAEEEETEEETEETESTEESEDTKQLTASELEKITARASDKGSRRALKTLAEELGFKGVGELKEFAKTQKEAEAEKLDEQTKATQEATRSQKEYEAKMAELADKELDLIISQQIVAKGVTDPKRTARIAALVRFDLEDDLSEEEWSEAVTETLQAVTEDMPELFTGAKGKGHGSGDGGAHGESEEEDDDRTAFEKKLRDEAKAKGLVEYTG